MSNITVKVTADVIDLQAKLAIAKAESSGFSKSLNALAKDAVAAGGANDQLKGKLLQAAEASTKAKNEVNQLSNEMKGVTGDTSQVGAAVEQLAARFGLGGGLGLAGAIAFAGVAISALETRLSAAVKTAEEFGIANARLAAVLGIDQSAAAGLGMALDDVGATTDDYVGMVLKLEKALKADEKGLNAVGMATRDSSNHLLNGKQLMDSAITTMQTYKAGTDQNEFALMAFGRGAKDVYQIMLLNDRIIADNSATLREFGVDVSPAATEAALELKLALAEQHDKWEAMQIALGQRVIPAIMHFLDVVGPAATPVLKAFESSLLTIAGAFYVVEVGARQAANVAVGAWHILGDVVTGNFDKIKSDAKAAWGHMESDAKNFKDGVAKLFSTPVVPKVSGSLYQSGDRNFVAPPKDDHGKAENEARKLAEALAQIWEQSALRHVQSEEQTNAHLLQIGRETLDQYLVQAESLENKRYGIELEGIHRREEADKGKKSELAKDHATEETLALQHEDRLTHLHEQGIEKRIQADNRETDEFIKDKQQALQYDTSAIENAYELHFIGDQQRHDLERQLTIVVQQEVLKRKDAEIAGLKQGTDAYRAAVRDREALERKFATDVRSIDSTLTKAQQAQFEQGFNIMANGFNGAITGMIFHGETFQAAMLQMASAVAEGFVNMGLEIAERWIMSQIETLLFEKPIALAKITDAAAIGAANAYAAYAEFPPLAAAMAGQAFATIESYAGLLSAEGGMERVQYDGQLIRAHAGESVLPRRIAEPLMSVVQHMSTSGGAPGFGGSPQYHVHNHMGLMDGRQASHVLQRNDMKHAVYGMMKDMARKHKIRLAA